MRRSVFSVVCLLGWAGGTGSGRGGGTCACQFFGCCFYSNWEHCCLPVSRSLYLYWVFYNNDVSKPFVLFLFFLVFPPPLPPAPLPSPFSLPLFYHPPPPFALPTGCAFVTFSTRAMAQNAIKAMHQSQTMEVLYSCPFFISFSLGRLTHILLMCHQFNMSGSFTGWKSGACFKPGVHVVT